MATNRTSLPLVWLAVAATAFGGLLAAGALAQPPDSETRMQPPALTQPRPIFDASRITVQTKVDAIAMTPTGQTTYFLSWTLRNGSGIAIWVEQGNRMPYAVLTDAGDVEVSFTVADIRPTRIAFFEVPSLVRVPNGGQLSRTFTVTDPLHTSSHYQLPSAVGVPLTSPFGVTLTVGYMTGPFTVPPSSFVILNLFLDRQREVRSNTLSF